MKTLSLKRQTAFTKQDHSKVKILLRLILLGMVVMVLALFYIWSRVAVVKMGYEIGELVKHQKDLKAQNQKLKLELSVLKAPERIEDLATEKLKMVWPLTENTYSINQP